MNILSTEYKVKIKMYPIYSIKKKKKNANTTDFDKERKTEREKR